MKMRKCIAELGVAFQHCNFFFNFSKNISGKKCGFFPPFFTLLFQFYFRKEGEHFFSTFFPKMFFAKLNFFL